jgi:MraZ protein
MYPGRLDDKGRLKLPAVFQKYFDSLAEKKLFVTSLDRKIAAIYPMAAWRQNEAIFDNFHQDPRAARAIYFTANRLGSEVEPDAQGRVLFNSDLRKALNLEGTELHLVAYRGHLEVMTEAIFQEQEQIAAVETAGALDTMMRAGLR